MSYFSLQTLVENHIFCKILVLENILTDGKRIYLSDFGLSLSSKFDLTPAETEFLKQHQSYDQACAAVNLLHCIIKSLFGKEHWEIRLREYLVGELNNLPPAII